MSVTLLQLTRGSHYQLFPNPLDLVHHFLMHSRIWQLRAKTQMPTSSSLVRIGKQNQARTPLGTERRFKREVAFTFEDKCCEVESEGKTPSFK